MTDTTSEDQAALAVVFEGHIKELVRKHLKDALEDVSFIESISNIYPLQSRLLRSIGGDINFQQAVKQAIMTQMQKY